MPGHGMIGHATEVGSRVTAFALGEVMAVSVIADSFRLLVPWIDGQGLAGLLFRLVRGRMDESGVMTMPVVVPFAGSGQVAPGVVPAGPPSLVDDLDLEGVEEGLPCRLC